MNKKWMQRTLFLLLLAGILYLLSGNVRAVRLEKENTQQTDEGGVSIEKSYTIYYNAVITDNGAYLIAVGWANYGGLDPKLQKEKSANNFKFFLEKSGGGIVIPVITPFCVTAQIPDEPRSINVTDDFGEYQIQVNGFTSVAGGENTPGDWIGSGKDAK